MCLDKRLLWLLCKLYLCLDSKMDHQWHQYQRWGKLERLWTVSVLFSISGTSDLCQQWWATYNRKGTYVATQLKFIVSLARLSHARTRRRESGTLRIGNSYPFPQILGGVNWVVALLQYSIVHERGWRRTVDFASLRISAGPVAGSVWFVR